MKDKKYMDKKFTEEELKQILEQHELWLKSNRKQGERANLEGANLDRINLKGANLKKANLERVSLKWADLENANLEGANLKGASLEWANFQWANLAGANLAGANSTMAKFIMASLAMANLTMADFTMADFTIASLTGANLVGANLTNTRFLNANLARVKLMTANLTGADFTGADFTGADFTGADLEGANLHGVKGFEGDTSTTLFTENIQYYEQTINQLEKELRLAETALKNSAADKEQVQKFQAEVDELNEKLKRVQLSKEQELKESQAKLNELQKKIKLENRINDAKKSLSNALVNTDTQISINESRAKRVGWGGMAVFSIAFCALIGIPIYIWCNNLFPENNWHLLFYTFPVIAMILIATTLLRHQKSLLNEVRHFSNMKHQIELYSGLLEASQHAAASFGDPKKADEYVQQTFTQIRDRLLQVQLPHDQPLAPASEEPADSNHLIGLLSKIADLGSKKLG